MISIVIFLPLFGVSVDMMKKAKADEYAYREGSFLVALTTGRAVISTVVIGDDFVSVEGRPGVRGSWQVKTSSRSY